MVRRTVDYILYRGLVPWLFLLVCSTALVTVGLVEAGPAAARQQREVNAAQIRSVADATLLAPVTSAMTFGALTTPTPFMGVLQADAARIAATLRSDSTGPPPPTGPCTAPTHGLTQGPSRNGWTESRMDHSVVNEEENAYRSEPGPESARIKKAITHGGDILQKTGGPEADLPALPEFSGPQQAVDGGAEAEDTATATSLRAMTCYKGASTKRTIIGGVVAVLLGGLLKTVGTGVCVGYFPHLPGVCYAISSVVGNFVAGLIGQAIAGDFSATAWGVNVGHAIGTTVAGLPAITKFATNYIQPWITRVAKWLAGHTAKYSWILWAGAGKALVKAGNGLIKAGHAARMYLINHPPSAATNRTTVASAPRHHHHRGAAGSMPPRRHRGARHGSTAKQGGRHTHPLRGGHPRGGAHGTRQGAGTHPRRGAHNNGGAHGTQRAAGTPRHRQLGTTRRSREPRGAQLAVGTRVATRGHLERARAFSPSPVAIVSVKRLDQVLA